MKYLIVGLGNVGAEYVGTRHNIGFDVVEEMAEEAGEKFKLERQAHVCKIKHRGRILVLIKPTTYMNLSGKAVKYWMQKENISVENTLIIADDLALPTGSLRMRKKGSDGGHNGLADIIRSLGSAAFPRLRIGIGNVFLKGQQVDFVLGKWTDEERNILEEKMKTMVDMVKSFTAIGIDRTMSQFNGK